MRREDVVVPESDAIYKNKLKYKSSSGRSGDGWKVTIYYNSDGSVDEKNTYCEWYFKEIH